MSVEKCINKYQEFLNTISEDVEDDFVRLGNLISCDKLSEFDEPIEFVNALHNISDKCYRITNKKTQFYTHRYDPSFIYELVSELDFADKILNVFDLTPRDSCCNCVSFVCYSKGKLNLLFDYLYSQKKSLDNIANNLDGFIARFYFDSSIFETIYRNYSSGNEFEKHISMECYRLLKYILTHYKAETYIYFCKMIVEGLLLDKVRTLRFLPLIESDVNVRVIREADGFVSYLDCHNIKLFTNVNKIGMFYEFSGSFGMQTLTYSPDPSTTYPNTHTTLHYSAWLQLYSRFKYLFMTSEENRERFIQYVQDNYNENYTRPPDSNIFKDNSINYMNYFKLFDVLAGTLAIKIKFSTEYLGEKINLISEIYTYSERYNEQPISKEIGNIGLLNVGYDEILLLELFEPIITLNKTNVKISSSSASASEMSSIANEVKLKIMSLFIFINNDDRIIYPFERITGLREIKIKFENNFLQKIVGTKISLLNEKSEYTIEQISKPEYKTKVDELITQITEMRFGIDQISSKDKNYGFVIDYLIDLAYKPEYLMPEFYDYFFNIGINLLNKKFFNVNETALQIWDSGNPEADVKVNKQLREEYFGRDIIKLNIYYTEIYPQSNSEPNVNYKSKYLKYKKKYLQMKKVLV
jgi:hypothetical protein